MSFKETEPSPGPLSDLPAWIEARSENIKWVALLHNGFILVGENSKNKNGVRWPFTRRKDEIYFVLCDHHHYETEKLIWEYQTKLEQFPIIKRAFLLIDGGEDTDGPTEVSRANKS